MGSIEKRVSAMEEHIEAEVRRRLEEELDAVIEELERNLSREEFVKVLEIMAGMDEGRSEEAGM